MSSPAVTDVLYAILLTMADMADRSDIQDSDKKPFSDFVNKLLPPNSLSIDTNIDKDQCIQALNQDLQGNIKDIFNQNLKRVIDKKSYPQFGSQTIRSLIGTRPCADFEDNEEENSTEIANDFQLLKIVQKKLPPTSDDTNPQIKQEFWQKLREFFGYK